MPSVGAEQHDSPMNTPTVPKCSTSSSTTPDEPPDPAQPPPAPSPAPLTRRMTPSTANQVDELFRRWTQAVAARFGGSPAPNGGREAEEEEEADPPLDKDDELEVWRSVFEPLRSEDLVAAGKEGEGKEAEEEVLSVQGLGHGRPMSHEEFQECVDFHAVDAGGYSEADFLRTADSFPPSVSPSLKERILA